MLAFSILCLHVSFGLYKQSMSCLQIVANELRAKANKITTREIRKEWTQSGMVRIQGKHTLLAVSRTKIWAILALTGFNITRSQSNLFLQVNNFAISLAQS